MLIAHLGAQEFNSVPLDHPAYDIIAMGVMKGIILPPPGVKPWSLHTVTQKLREITGYSAQILSARETAIALHTLDSLERTTGYDPKNGRYRTENENAAFEAGLGLESHFFTGAPDTPFTNNTIARLYLGGGRPSASWNLAALGEILAEENKITLIPAAEGELNGVFNNHKNQNLQLRLGRIRHDWGYGPSGASLFLNGRAYPFTAFEWTFLPLQWMNISFLCGALEHSRENNQWLREKLFSSALTAAQVEIIPMRYFRFCLGGAAALRDQPDGAFFTGIELTLPGPFLLWGSLFIDRLNASAENFLSLNSNSYAWQTGARAHISWIPFAAFTVRYTKIEPYCYSAFINGGESLGYYLPPNSDELFLRAESTLFPGLNAHVQFQMIRHGAGYGYGAVDGSSRHDSLANNGTAKYFLMDGVYQWDNAVKSGVSYRLKAGGVPVLVYAEAGLVITKFTINGKAGVGNEADYQSLNDDVYRARNRFVFSAGFRLFP